MSFILVNPLNQYTQTTYGTFEEIFIRVSDVYAKTPVFYQGKIYPVAIENEDGTAFVLDVCFTHTLVKYKRSEKDCLEPFSSADRLNILETTFSEEGGTSFIFKILAKICWTSDLSAQIIRPHREDRLAKLLQIKPNGLMDAVEMAMNEVDIMNLLPDFHPKFPTVDIDERYIFISMRELPGICLSKALGRLPCKAETLLSLALELAVGLKGQMHDKQFVHRDVKPGNVMIQFEGDRVSSAKYIDFGFSQSMDPDKVSIRSRFSYLNKACGTHGFISPVTRRTGVAAYASDIYSLGILFCIIFRAYPSILNRGKVGLRNKLFSMGVIPGLFNGLDCDALPLPLRSPIKNLILGMVDMTRMNRPALDSIIGTLDNMLRGLDSVCDDELAVEDAGESFYAFMLIQQLQDVDLYDIPMEEFLTRLGAVPKELRFRELSRRYDEDGNTLLGELAGDKARFLGCLDLCPADKRAALLTLPGAYGDSPILILCVHRLYNTFSQALASLPTEDLMKVLLSVPSGIIDDTSVLDYILFHQHYTLLPILINAFPQQLIKDLLSYILYRCEERKEPGSMFFCCINREKRSNASQIAAAIFILQQLDDHLTLKANTADHGDFKPHKSVIDASPRLKKLFKQSISHSISTVAQHTNFQRI